MNKEALSVVDTFKMALEALENNKQKHHYCEDTWYSCPKHEEGCANDSEGDECNCGADKINAQFDKAITSIKEALMSLQDGAQPAVAEQHKQQPKCIGKAWAMWGGPVVFDPPLVQPEQEPVGLVSRVAHMDVIVVNLVREGINKHRARELAEHFLKYTHPPVPTAQPDCTRSHPHEEMSKECELRTEIARLTNELARLKAQPKEPEQEPVAWAHKEGLESIKNFDASVYANGGFADAVPLYTTPPPVTESHKRKPLTDEEIFEINNGLATWMFPVETRVTDRELAFARAIEAAHGIRPSDFKE